MIITLVLPRSLHKSVGNNLKIDACKMSELLKFISENLPSLKEEILENDSAFKRNILIIFNGNLVSKKDLSDIAFTENSTLEIMFQFAGG